MPTGVDGFQDIQMQHMVAKVLAKGYFEHYKSDWVDLNWKGLEQVFDIPYTTKKGNTIRLRGKLDGAYESRGGLFLFETKTKGRIDSAYIVDTLGFDLQVGLYSYAMERVYGEAPRGVLYNVIRRPQLKRKASERMSEFESRIASDIDAQPEHYYMRFPLLFDDAERARWEVEFSNMVDHLEAWYGNMYRYRNPSSCKTYWGSCPFLRICSSNDRTLYRKREGLFLELSGEQDEATS